VENTTIMVCNARKTNKETTIIFCEEYNYLSKCCISCDEVLLLLSHVSFSGSTENWGVELRKGKQWY
jgi:hypothetical protein